MLFPRRLSGLIFSREMRPGKNSENSIILQSHNQLSARWLRKKAETSVVYKNAEMSLKNLTTDGTDFRDARKDHGKPGKPRKTLTTRTWKALKWIAKIRRFGQNQGGEGKQELDGGARFHRAVKSSRSTARHVAGLLAKMGVGRTFCFGHNLARSTKRREKMMNAETSKAGKTIWAFDLGKGSISDLLRRRDSAARAVRCGDKFLHKASLLIPAEFADNKKGACETPRTRVAVVSHALRFSLPRHRVAMPCLRS